MGNRKRILLVDDSDIDREVLRYILNEEYDVVETQDGYSALDIILKKGEEFDGVLLDVSMPFFDGISVLRVLRENNLHDVQVLMITAEATKENIEKASQYNIADFIRKPFDREDILRRLRRKFSDEGKGRLTKADIAETKKYISDLENIYERYLSLTGQDKARDARRAYFMKVMLGKASARGMVREKLDGFQVEMISKAAYLCNIGNMLLQSMPIAIGAPGGNIKSGNDQQHTVMGARLLRLNYSDHCKRFVGICSEICLNHHERFDGNGSPNGRNGNISIYAQICGLLERFEELFSGYSGQDAAQFDYVVNELGKDSGLVSNNVFMLLMESKAEIIKYYGENRI